MSNARGEGIVDLLNTQLPSGSGVVQPPSPPDAVNPAHYRDLRPEPIEAIEGWNLGFCLGNAVKYIARAGRKGDALEDLKKARWYLDREIARRGESNG